MTSSLDAAKKSPRARFVTALVSGAASGALTLIDPARFKPCTRRSLVGGSGAAYAAVAWVGSSGSAEYKPGNVLRGSLSLGLGALGAIATHYSFALDSKIHQGLLRRGIGNPRPLMAVGSGILTAALVLLEAPGREAEPLDYDADAGPAEREISVELREVLTGMLGATEDFGAAQLREQLAGAREQYWAGPEEFTCSLSFVVPQDADRTVPRNFIFPVHADFTTPDGHPMRVSLQVHDGTLDTLLIDVQHEQLVTANTDDDDPFESITGWPLASEVVFTPEA
ncbi:hypothetical protein BLJ79_13760 [Arthrobacter sp. UCD-GKA]|uniref:hypothetical protein n=1 Tax=Arthrobacter sp. UCD-GKA TaxID=1913576 RepID=UPI0008DD1650|nr:hypothetical protein [Arthrobacter sp. UCD-GKA]OIH83767.1 hypothetical protein BLJ79_13760 [Arthrobacter sp. UCD-GKA]